jgi:hypothetical protein
MRKKNNFILSLVTCFFLLISIGAIADSEEIGKIIEQIKVSQDLEKLNECRIKLRAIDFSQLRTKEEQVQFAEAYKQLAVAYKSHRYSRPAYDIYQKYISLNDTILKLEKNKQLSELLNKHAQLNSDALKQISESEQERKSLIAEKEILDSIKKSYFRYSLFFSIVLLTLFIFIFRMYNNKLSSSKNLLIGNRNNIFKNNEAVTNAQMAIGVINRLKILNETNIYKLSESSSYLEQVEKEVKGIKEVEQNLKSLISNIQQLKQATDHNSKILENLVQGI